MDTKKQIGLIVQQLRKRQGLSQETLAAAAKLDAKSLSRLERGVHYPAIETLERIATVLNVELKDFFDFTAAPSTEELRKRLRQEADQADEEKLRRVVSWLDSQ
ncbi:helix-turn-helix transcriptional regulator [Vogesella sp. DC21W]|uniref:Helix-turn-helix transcriptional regulator n=1 Tax=Vogesella aquatica TaxID=2984206 RepID=A0ABT5IXD2_9NEIS|nr:helix-turn-helix transcriptional regulator [Vogesella aquatica]MDC7716853.1 helix-turn-helix transcriptional regulator [Vogesella aquatica]